MMSYIHNSKDWPKLTWNQDRMAAQLAGLRHRHVDGVVEMMLDTTGHFADPLNEERLFAWHAALFPTGRSGMTKIAVGRWRDDQSDPMRVVFGPIGRKRCIIRHLKPGVFPMR